MSSTPPEHFDAEAFTVRQARPVQAEWLYALTSWLIALALLMLLPSQTRYVANNDWMHQPALFSVVSIVGMLLFGVLELINAWRLRRTVGGEPWFVELMYWVKGLEFAGWFMVYVWAVPWLGYLLATLLFCVSLVWRLGYRQRRYLLSALAVGVVTVLVFKTGLSVKIPSGAWYESLPDPLQTIFIIYL